MAKYNIPMLNPSDQNSWLIDTYQKSIIDLLKGGKYILGEKVDSFESLFAEYIDSNFAIGISSGTDALIASLIALGIGLGDEVICPSFTFFATAGAIVRVGAKPIFVDILPDSFNINPDKIKEAITNKTKAIIPVHLFGQACQMDQICSIAKDYNLYVIEDCAQAFGATFIDGKKVGSIGDIGCFSFFPSKNLGGFGDAGLCTTNSSSLAEKLKQTRNHGMTKPYEHSFVGGNFRIDALQAHLLELKLPNIENYLNKRNQHSQIYFSTLNDIDEIILPCQVLENRNHTYNQFTIRVHSNKRNSLQEFLKSKGITTSIYYPTPLHKQKCFDNLDRINLPETDKACQEVLSLPIASELSDEQIYSVAITIKTFFSI